MNNDEYIRGSSARYPNISDVIDLLQVYKNLFQIAETDAGKFFRAIDLIMALEVTLIKYIAYTLLT